VIRVGHGFDVHRLVEGRRLVLGGVEIPSHVGALGHSDADVVAHAISDALLGAAALGDLGGHFPDSDPQWKDANSIVLLEACIQRVRDAGYTLCNVDATIVVDKPKLAPYIGAMREVLATRLGVALEAVSVKAKTSEGMGYTGDGTGIAAYAVALIERASKGS
jgi:2-C-methyl-D-erythritol 2,4-cyclodiphosphate synthase